MFWSRMPIVLAIATPLSLNCVCPLIYINSINMTNSCHKRDPSTVERPIYEADGLTLRMKLSSGCSCWSRVAFRMCCSNCMSLFLGTSRAGKRSPMRPMKIGVSSTTIFGTLKSLSALINTWRQYESTHIYSRNFNVHRPRWNYIAPLVWHFSRREAAKQKATQTDRCRQQLQMSKANETITTHVIEYWNIRCRQQLQC